MLNLVIQLPQLWRRNIVAGIYVNTLLASSIIDFFFFFFFLYQPKKILNIRLVTFVLFTADTACVTDSCSVQSGAQSNMSDLLLACVADEVAFSVQSFWRSCCQNGDSRSFCSFRSSVRIKCLVHLLCWQVRGSNLDSESGCPDRNFLFFVPAPHPKFLEANSGVGIALN
jgi:hypothetical protein